MKNKEDFYKYGELLGIKINDLQRLKMLADACNENKYTEEDIRKAIEVGVNAEAGDYPEGYSLKLGITLEDYFINSLNNQD
jgi:hypothetical protein